jgi:thiamine-monophosphate kinase
MKVSELGEFVLIDLLAKMVADSQGERAASRRIISDIGDDTAAWHVSDSVQLVTVDAMVQDVHFTLDTITWEELGWKSLAINLSDIAAMGGVPEYALIALGLPGNTDVENMGRFYEGMLELANHHDVAIVGGNMCSSPIISITITVTGSSPDGRILRRSTAKPGDLIAMTGYAGSAAAGLAMLKEKLQFGAETATYLRTAFMRPQPRISEGQLLLKNGVTTAIDISDGLLADLRHICEASNIGARVDADKVPVHTGMQSKFGERARELALTGGEDYELLFAGSAEVIDKVEKEVTCPVTIIGEITEGEDGKVRAIDAEGNAIKVNKAGWEHF